MGLLLTEVRLTDFRNYSSFVLGLDPCLTILVGKNAAGKTNVAEAVQLVTACESFRRPQWSELVRERAGEARVDARIEGDGRVIDVGLHVTREGKREYCVNGKKKRRVSEVAGVLPSVMFTPDDLSLVKGSAEQRRAALDGVGDQLSQTYRQVRNDYERTLRQRNALLKEHSGNTDLLSSLTDRLLETATPFSALRKRLFERILSKMSEILPLLSGGEALSGSYVESWEGESSRTGGRVRGLGDALEALALEERRRGLTLAGPHRDDITLLLDGRNSRTFGSQGQQRTTALAWKLAEVGVITEATGQAPVLLLDDVMSELDEARRHALARFCGEIAQTVVTTTNLGYFEQGLVSRARVVHLS